MKKDDPSFYNEGEEEFALKAIEMNLKQTGIFLVAKDKDKVVGFCNLFGKEGRVEIGIGIHPQYRNKGVGRLLLNEIFKEARKKSLKKIYAGVKKDNKNSLEFFNKNGFEKIKEKQDTFLFKKEI